MALQPPKRWKSVGGLRRRRCALLLACGGRAGNFLRSLLRREAYLAERLPDDPAVDSQRGKSESCRRWQQRGPATLPARCWPWRVRREEPRKSDRDRWFRP